MQEAAPQTPATSEPESTPSAESTAAEATPVVVSKEPTADQETTPTDGESVAGQPAEDEVLLPELEVDPTAETTSTVAEEAGPSSMVWLDFFKPEGIPYAFIILFVMTVVARIISRQAEILGDRIASQRLAIQQAGSFLRFVVYMLGIGLAVLTLFDLTEQMLLAIGGTVAVAAGFAMKDLVASLIAGIIILADRPFQVGDRVTFAGYYGEVTHIGLRSVRLMTLDDTQVTIPNNKFLTEAVASGNAGAVDMMIQVDLYIGIDQDLEEAAACSVKSSPPAGT